MNLQCIVEGKGERHGATALLRRLSQAGGVYDIALPPAQRANLSQLVKPETLISRLELAAGTGASAILVLFDADERCPRDHWNDLQACVKRFRVPTGLAVANCEYEAWFLASLSDLRGSCSIKVDAVDHPHPERPRDAKGILTEAMLEGRSYTPTTDQEKLTHRIDLAKAHARCRSFRKLTAEFGDLLDALGRTPAWPAEWRQHGA